MRERIIFRTNQSLTLTQYLTTRNGESKGGNATETRTDPSASFYEATEVACLVPSRSLSPSSNMVTLEPRGKGAARDERCCTDANTLQPTARNSRGQKDLLPVLAPCIWNISLDIWAIVEDLWTAFGLTICVSGKMYFEVSGQKGHDDLEESIFHHPQRNLFLAFGKRLLRRQKQTGLVYPLILHYRTFRHLPFTKTIYPLASNRPARHERAGRNLLNRRRKNSADEIKPVIPWVLGVLLLDRMYRLVGVDMSSHGLNREV